MVLESTHLWIGLLQTSRRIVDNTSVVIINTIYQFNITHDGSLTLHYGNAFRLWQSPFGGFSDFLSPISRLVKDLGLLSV